MNTADAGIYGQLIRPAAPADPLEQYAKMMSIQNAMGQQELQGLKMQTARRGIADEDAVREAYKASGGNPAVLRTLLYGGGQHKAVEALDKSQMERDAKQATMAHTNAQTGQINAGHVAGALAALAQNGGSDEGVANAERIMTQAGAPNAKAVTATLMGMPPELRVKFAMAQAASNKVGQDALKILFPNAHMQNFGGTTAPVSTSTLPGSTPGAAVPGGVVTANTQTPDSVASRASIESEGRLNRGNATANALMADSRQRDATAQAGTHRTNTVDDAGMVTVHTLDRQGNLIKSTPTGGKAPSVLSNENVRERQLATGLEAVKKPHLEVLNAYQRYGEIRGTGDNAQANQMLAQQIMQMSKTGQRVIPQKELERILGSGDLGNDWIGRAANMVSQMATGVRTPTIDKRLNDLADAMGKASADRIGQEIQNTIARTPNGVDSARVVGAKPTIYGRFIITPTGKVHTFASPEEARAKLQEAAKVMGE